MGQPLGGTTRLTLAPKLGNALDGAWWPHTSSVARELPDLIDALKRPLGRVVNIDVNWSALAGLPNLDALNWRGHAAVLGRDARHQRVMTLTGRRARARLLVVPSHTSTALAVMLLRRAARLPILYIHQNTDAFRVADGLIRAVRAADASTATSAAGSA